MERIGRELRRQDDSVEAVRWAEQSRTSPMQLHPYYRMQERSTSYQRGRSSAPNLAAFTAAAAAAGMVTALLFETQEEEQSWLGKANDGPRSPYPSPLASPAPCSYQPNPLRVRLEFVMTEQQRLGAELEALAEQKRSRETSRRKRELGKALKDLEAEQSILLEEAKRQLLRQTK
ncbi:hypothetical protein COCOBI_04-8260 [Coccomyxa sp. Obi]|nr:hypothetical protein COCOBI_04-8260 [Coccomyxa sp. Obi]